VALKKKSVPTDWLICNLSIVPLYSRASETSVIISQLLFGETVHIIQKKNKQWAKVQSTFDQVEAWVDLRQLEYITQDQHEKFNDNFAVALEVCQVLINNDLTYPVMIGSSLPVYDGMLFRTHDAKYVYNGQAAIFNEVSFTSEMLEKIARRFVNAPYFQGGRSIFGLDKSALVQLVLKCAGKSLPRSIFEMYNTIDQTVDFIELAQAGDVAFFINKNEEIDHIGILLSKDEILHVNEKATIDRIDHEGIYNITLKKYTHKLKVIARFV
jgi:gamma-D-glutamyl-L-lysine dipeptidyl-peptidase